MLFVAAVVQGWNQTGTNGRIQPFNSPQSSSFPLPCLVQGINAGAGANLSWWADLHSSEREAVLRLGNGATIDFGNQTTVEVQIGSAVVLENEDMLRFDDQTTLTLSGMTSAILDNGTLLRFDAHQTLHFDNGTVLHFGNSGKKIKCGRDPTGVWEFAAVNAAPYLAASVYVRPNYQLRWNWG